MRIFSSKLWSSQLWTQFKQLRREAWKNHDFNEVWTRDPAIPVRRSNQLSFEATDVESWSFVSTSEPVKNGCEVIYEIIEAKLSNVAEGNSKDLFSIIANSLLLAT